MGGIGEERIIPVDKLLLYLYTSEFMERILTSDKETQSCIRVYITSSYIMYTCTCTYLVSLVLM